MRIAIGADHAGFELKEHVKALLLELEHQVLVMIVGLLTATLANAEAHSAIIQTGEGVSVPRKTPWVSNSPAQIVAVRAELFPLSAVRLLAGPFSRAADADREYIQALDPDRLLAPFRREAGLEPRKPAYGNWESGGLDGHTAGHYLSALADMIASGHDTKEGELRRRLDYMVAEMELVQQANGDGYIGGVPGSREFWKSIAAGQVGVIWKKWVPWYNVHKTFAGLRDAYVAAGNAKARDLLTRLGDWAGNVTAKLSDAQMQQMLGQEHGGMNEVLADIYALKVRAANGHPSPYKVKYWEIDNEIYLTRIPPDVYLKIANTYADAFKRIDPSLVVVGCGGGGTSLDADRGWQRRLLESDLTRWDFSSLHKYENYAGNGGGHEDDDSRFQKGVAVFEEYLSTLRARYAQCSHPGLRLYMSEWNYMSTDWRTGLYAGGMLNVLERNSDLVSMACPALLLRHVSAPLWDNALINFDHRGWFPAPNYVVMKLWPVLIRSVTPKALGYS